MQTVKVITAQNIDIDFDVASLGDRIFARLIDIGILFGTYLLAIILLVLTTGGTELFKSTGSKILVGFVVVIIVFYDLICEILINGQSVGKRVMKIKVISLDGAQPGIGQYLLRWVFRLVDFSLTGQAGGLICVALTKNKQRIGDLVAGTTLIKTSPRTTISHVAFMPKEIDYTPVYQEVILLSDADLTLIHEVLFNYNKSHNHVLVSIAAEKIRKMLAVSNGKLMSDVKFLQTIIEDYNHITSKVEV